MTATRRPPSELEHARSVRGLWVTLHPIDRQCLNGGRTQILAALGTDARNTQSPTRQDADANNLHFYRLCSVRSLLCLKEPIFHHIEDLMARPKKTPTSGAVAVAEAPAKNTNGSSTLPTASINTFYSASNGKGTKHKGKAPSEKTLLVAPESPSIPA